MKNKPLLIIPTALLVLIVVRFFGAQLGMVGAMVEHFYPGIISTGSWIRCLENDPTAHGYSIYGYLENRETDAALDHALEHIHSDDDYLWLNASTYLASRGRQESIPFLIKALRHTAWRSVDERIKFLEVLTGQRFGNDFTAWKKWYIATDPEIIPDWISGLGHSPKIETKAKSLEATATSAAPQL